MEAKDSDKDFTFSIEGKDYTISEKKDSPKNNDKQTLHVPSLTIGAIISGICIAVVVLELEFIWDIRTSDRKTIDRRTDGTCTSQWRHLKIVPQYLKSKCEITLVEFGIINVIFVTYTSIIQNIKFLKTM